MRQQDHVLVVDDDEGIRGVLCELLSAAGYVPEAVASGEEALLSARRARPALALLDVRLPGISGYEVCRALRELYGDDLPIIFLSGARAEAFDRAGGLLLGADDYVVKPFDHEELLARVRRFLARARREEGIGADLTTRERDVLGLLASGLSQADIAARLVISPHTVATHIERILSKLGAHSRAQAVAIAYRKRLIDVSEPGDAEARA